MSHRGVEITLGRLATDAVLRERFRENPARALGELTALGIELNAVEAAALATLDPAAVQRFALALDLRLQRAVSPARPVPSRTASETQALDAERRTP
jgi:hypothetical protein